MLSDGASSYASPTVPTGASTLEAPSRAVNAIEVLAVGVGLAN